MRWIYGTDLPNTHQDETIWIVGSSKRVEQYPTGFFGNKIAIAANWSFIAFPECEYITWYHFTQSEIIRDYRPDLLKKALLPQPLQLVKDVEAFFGKYIEDPIFFERPERPTDEKEMQKIVSSIVSKNETRYVNNKTVVHSAILAATTMGAKRIILVGCEHEYKGSPPYLSGKNAHTRGMWFFYPEVFMGLRKESINLGTPDVKKNIASMRAGTNWLAQALDSHGIELLRHTYGEGFRPVIQSNKERCDEKTNQKI